MKQQLVSTKVIFVLGIFTVSILGSSAVIYRGTPLLSNESQSQAPSPTLPLVIDDKNTMTGDVPESIYKNTIARLKVLRVSGSFEDMVKERDKIESKWGAKGGPNYGLLYRELLGALTSSRIVDSNPSSLDLSQQYVVTALKRADLFNLETEYYLLMYLRYPIYHGVLDVSGVEQRRERVKLWLHAFHRMENEKDPNFNPNDRPALNVQPPAGSNILPGMPPDAIKDPKLRAEYEKAIAENKKKIGYINTQRRLRQNEGSMIKDGVRYISKMYTQSPSDMGELTKLIVDAKISKGLQKDIEIEVQNAAVEN